MCLPFIGVALQHIPLHIGPGASRFHCTCLFGPAVCGEIELKGQLLTYEYFYNGGQRPSQLTRNDLACYHR